MFNINSQIIFMSHDHGNQFIPYKFNTLHFLSLNKNSKPLLVEDILNIGIRNSFLVLILMKSTMSLLFTKVMKQLSLEGRL